MTYKPESMVSVRDGVSQGLNPDSVKWTWMSRQKWELAKINSDSLRQQN